MWLAIVFFLHGCASPEQYQRLARAGIAYTVAVGDLIQVAGQTRIDSTSEKLLVVYKPLGSSTDMSEYDSLSKQDLDYLEALELLRQNTSLLGRYFDALNRLATSVGPTAEAVRVESTSIGGSLDALGLKIAGNSKVDQSEVSGKLGKIIVSAALQGALGEELRTRKGTLRSALAYQEVLVDVLGANLQSDLKTLRNAREKRLVKDPLKNPSAKFDDDGWITTRGRILTASEKLQVYEKANAAEQALRSAFKELVAGDIDQSKVNRLMSDLERL